MNEERYVELVDSLVDFCNDLESLIVKLRGRIQGFATEEKCWDPRRIEWYEAEGPKGIYERSEDASNPEFKALVKDLKRHKGKLSRDGLFYWLFRAGHIVGRKKKVHQ